MSNEVNRADNCDYGREYTAPHRSAKAFISNTLRLMRENGVSDVKYVRIEKI